MAYLHEPYFVKSYKTGTLTSMRIPCTYVIKISPVLFLNTQGIRWNCTASCGAVSPPGSEGSLWGQSGYRPETVTRSPAILSRRHRGPADSFPNRYPGNTRGCSFEHLVLSHRHWGTSVARPSPPVTAPGRSRHNRTPPTGRPQRTGD